MSAFSLKIIAIVGMTMNHIAYAFGGSMPDWLYYIFMAPGGLTFPIMAYLMSEGYKYTRDIKKYALRLFGFALLALVPFCMLMNDFRLNVLFTLLGGLIVLYLNDHMKSRGGFWAAFIGITLFTLISDWTLMGVPMVLCYRCITDRYKRVVAPVCIVWVMIGLSLFLSGNLLGRESIAQGLFGFVGCTATIPLLLAYNGERGRSMKYLFYAFYPAHLLIISVIRIIFK